VAEKMSFSGSGSQLATLSQAGKILQIWNPRTGELLREIAADETTRFEAIALNKPGTRVAVISQTSPANAVELAVWSTETGELLWLRPLGTAKEPLSGASFAQVAFSPDDQQIMSQVNLGTSDPGRAEGQLQLQNATTGEVLQLLDYAADGNAALRKFAFSPDGKLLATASHLPVQEGRLFAEDRVNFWWLNSDNRFYNIQTIQLLESDFAFVDMTFTNSGLLNFLRQQIQGTRLSSWNVGTGDDYGYTELPGADRTDMLIHLSPDGRHYFLRGDVAGTRLGNVYTKEVKDLAGVVNAATFSENGDYLALANAQNIRIFAKTIP
jgi:WD40 repeat protein